jgi:hypothetical protein
MSLFSRSAGIKWFAPLLLGPLAFGAHALAAASIVSFNPPRGLVASTGNLYWTAQSAEETGPDAWTVWRASKSNVPGNEIALYRELGDDRNFGAIVYANPGAFYGYFVANYQFGTGWVSQIKRIPLAGGPAVVIATSPAVIGLRDLVTDGSALFWVDAQGIRRVALSGGPVTTLYSSPQVTRLRVDSSYLYFGEEYLIFRMPKTGGLESVLASTSGLVTALHFDTASGWLFWGEQGGGVFAMHDFPNGPRVTYQAPSPGRDVTSVGWDGSRVLWSDCLEPGDSSCRIKKVTGAVTQTLVTGGVGVRTLQWDTTSFYWGNIGFLKKYVY